MRVDDLTGIVPLHEAFPSDTEIAGLSSDSRAIGPGMLFFALAGAKADGAAFAADAASRGALAVVMAKGRENGALSVPAVEVDDPRRALALAAAKFYRAQPRTMVAVTGTSGKTSVAAFTRQIWEQAGCTAASIGTTGVDAPGRSEYGSIRWRCTSCWPNWPMPA